MHTPSFKKERLNTSDRPDLRTRSLRITPKPSNPQSTMHPAPKRIYFTTFCRFTTRNRQTCNYKAFRAAVPPNGGFDDFSSAYKTVYGKDLSKTLETMQDHIIHGQRAVLGCDEGELLAWSDPQLFAEHLHGKCGDASFFGSGLLPNSPAFTQIFSIDIPTSGLYQTSLLDPAGASVIVENCPGTASGRATADIERSSNTILHKGRHSMTINQTSEIARGASISLELITPLPP